MTTPRGHRQEDPQKSKSSNSAPVSRSGSAALWIFAVVLLVAYVLVRIWLYFKAGDPGVTDPLWDRYTFVVAGLDSVVTVVVGWLFGREVHRKSYEDAMKREKESRAQ